MITKESQQVSEIPREKELEAISNLPPSQSFLSKLAAFTERVVEPRFKKQMSVCEAEAERLPQNSCSGGLSENPSDHGQNSQQWQLPTYIFIVSFLQAETLLVLEMLLSSFLNHDELLRDVRG